jgi:hypothetical protein
VAVLAGDDFHQSSWFLANLESIEVIISQVPRLLKLDLLLKLTHTRMLCSIHSANISPRCDEQVIKDFASGEN